MIKTNKKRFMFHLPLVDARQAIKCLTLEAEAARSLREFGRVSAIADKLMTITKPLSLEAIAIYYKAVSLDRNSVSMQAFEQLSDCPIAVVRGRAELALGAAAYLKSDYQAAGAHYERAVRQLARGAFDPVGTFHLVTMRAILTGAQGNHQQSLVDLQNIYKITRATSRKVPVLEYTLLNSIALELNELGQHGAALSLIERVVASPYAAYYPEWQESAAEIRQSQPSQRIAVPGYIIQKRAQVMRERTIQMRAQVRAERVVRLARSGRTPTDLTNYRAQQVSKKWKLTILERLFKAELLTDQQGSQILGSFPA